MNKHSLLVYAVLLLLSAPSVQAQDFIIEKLQTTIYSQQYDVIAPCVSKDGQTLYFTRCGAPDFEKTLYEDGRNLGTIFTKDQFVEHLKGVYSILEGKTIYDPVASGFNQDIWIARTVGGTFDMVYHPGYPLNNALPNSISTIMPSGHEMIVINQFTKEGGMQKGFSKVSQSEEGKWSFPMPVQIDNYHNSGQDVNLTMSNDGSTLIIAMEDPTSLGKSDLYVSIKKADGNWSKPQNLGPHINSSFRETTPFLSPDLKTLYYASDRNIKTGSDIYVQTRVGDSWTQWTAPKRFKFPINSRSHDSHPYFNEATGYLYFTSKRDQSWDIFRIQIEKPMPTGVTLRGIVLNKATMTPVQSDILAISQFGKDYEYFPTAVDGTFRLTIPWKDAFTLQAKKEGFKGEKNAIYFEINEEGEKEHFIKLFVNPDENTLLAQEENTENSFPKNINKKPSSFFENEQPDTTTNDDAIAASNANQAMSASNVININAHAKELKVGQKIDLPTIYFKRSTPAVLQDSYGALNQLSKFLKEHSNIYIRVIGHTDNQGEKEALLKLSGDRAKSIKEYLVYKRFINPLRIKVAGMGGTSPINDNSTETMRKQNRRVEIEIIHIEKESTLGLRNSVPNKK